MSNQDRAEAVSLPSWTMDCQGKQDMDGDIVRLSVRYYPGNYREDGRPSTIASITVGIDDLMEAEFDAPTEAEVKALTEDWAKQQIARIKAAIATPQAPGADTQGGRQPYGWLEPETGNFVDQATKLAMPHDASTYTLPIYTHPAESSGGDGAWLPIETAPKDGTHIIGFWVSDAYTEPCEVRAVIVWSRGSWHHGSGYDHEDEFPKPTHWQPLPPPPRALGKGGA